MIMPTSIDKELSLALKRLTDAVRRWERSLKSLRRSVEFVLPPAPRDYSAEIQAEAKQRLRAAQQGSEKQREFLTKNSREAAREAVYAGTDALRAKTAAAEVDLLRRRPHAKLSAIEERREKILAKRHSAKFDDEAIRGIQAELLQRQRNLENEAAKLSLREKRARREGETDKADELEKRADELRAKAGELTAFAGDKNKIRDEFSDSIEEQVAHKRLEAYYARREARAKTLLSLTRETARTLTEGLVNAVEKGGKLKDHFKNIGRQLLKLALQKLVIAPATGLLSNALGSLFKLPGKVPGKAAGGPVEAGRLYRVGERGEELFRPRVSGEIIANHKLRPALAGGGGGNVFHFDIDIQSSDGPGVRAALAEAAPLIESRVSRAVKGEIRADLARPSTLSRLA